MWDTDINYLAVIAAGAVTMVVGFLWYSEILFGKIWMKAINKSKEQIEKDAAAKGPLMYLWPFLSAIVMYYFLAVVMKSLGVENAVDGMQVGLAAWFGFVAMSQIPAAVFQETKKEVVLLYVGYQLACFLINSAILGAWK